MSTINAGSVIRGDVVNLQGHSDSLNGVVEMINKNGTTVHVKIRCRSTGEVFSYTLPYTAKLNKVVNIVR